MVRKFQDVLIETPDAGNIVKNTGGIRKIRCKLKGIGKRGGLRIIYYWHVLDSHIYRLFFYLKNELEHLKKDNYAVLKTIVNALE